MAMLVLWAVLLTKQTLIGHLLVSVLTKCTSLSLLGVLSLPPLTPPPVPARSSPEGKENKRTLCPAVFDELLSVSCDESECQF